MPVSADALLPSVRSGRDSQFSPGSNRTRKDVLANEVLTVRNAQSPRRLAMQGQASPLPVSKTGGRWFKSLRTGQLTTTDSESEDTADPVQRAPDGAPAAPTLPQSVIDAV